MIIMTMVDGQNLGIQGLGFRDLGFRGFKV